MRYYQLSRYITNRTELDEDGLPTNDSSIRYEDLDSVQRLSDAKLVGHEYLSAGDYSGNDGGTVRANVNWWNEEFGQWQSKLWWSLWGSHGSFGVVIDARVLTDTTPFDDEPEKVYAAQQMREALESLEEYPLLDEEGESNLRMELEQQQFPEAARDDDFALHLVEAMQNDLQDVDDSTLEDAADAVEVDRLMGLYSSLSDLFGVNVDVEGSGDNLSALFYIDRWVEGFTQALEGLRIASPVAATEVAQEVYAFLITPTGNDANYSPFSYGGWVYKALSAGREISQLRGADLAVVQDHLLEQGDAWVTEQLRNGTLLTHLRGRGFRGL